MSMVKEAGAYSFTIIDAPGMTGGIASGGTVAFGINDTGTVVGSDVDHGVYYGFTYNGITYSTLNVPGAIGGTVAYGINDTGSVAGYYADAAGYHGFTYNGSTYSTLNVPGAIGTAASGINDTGSVAGTYWDGMGNHGFIATAQVGDPSYVSVPEPSTLLLLGSGMIGLVATRRFRKQ